ncbi:uncharacterized protein LOC142988366 [Genypterus blacodes]|uniref:uncharacterized protein LOC142988366 n=1 Tax=Genypterus blacodes TaxID=154954 RepID=UPI003F760C4F
MAEARSKEPDPLSCSICLEVLKSPVTLQCGHTFCNDCIGDCWDLQDQSGVYRCPDCRQVFTSRPVLNKNTVLAGLIEKQTQKAEARPPPAKAEDGDVECDFCSVTKLKAVKSCLVCLASYCSTHLQPHYDSAAFKRHKLVDVSVSMEENICLKHNKVLEVFCRTDDQCVCLLCVMDEHKGHDTVSAAAGRKERQAQFGKKKQHYQHGIQVKEKLLRELRQKMKELKSSGGAAVDESEKAFISMILMAESRRAAVKEQIRVQEKAAVSRAEALVVRLERELSELRKREDDLKQLSLTDNHIHFLQNCRSMFDCSEPELSSGANIRLHSPFDFVTKAVNNMRKKLENIAKAIADISETIGVDSDPNTRQEFSLYSCQLFLDPNTAFENLLLSEGNSKVNWVRKAVSYPPHPERFIKFDQVLCTEGLTGVCYWELEWVGKSVEVAVSYKGPDLDEQGFGYTDQSWCLSLSNSGCVFWHSGVRSKIHDCCSSTVGVYLNHSAGSLSFYSVPRSGPMLLLHRVQTTFTQPLYAGFMLSKGASVRILSPASLSHKETNCQEKMAVNHELFGCSICLELLVDPVTTACGHSYCMHCINSFWDNKDTNGGQYSCPQCRQTFHPRPVLKRNTLLAGLLEEPRKQSSEHAAGDECDNDTDVPMCDACVGRKRKACMFCLVCLVSYCETHLKPHFDVGPLKKHCLVQATETVKERICHHHGKLQEVYCRTDQQCICLLCAMDQHKGHDTVSVETEKCEILKQLEWNRQEVVQRGLNSEKKMEDLRLGADSIREAAWETLDDFERLCVEHIHSYVRSVERKCEEMREQVGKTEKAGLDWTSSHAAQLQREASELMRRERQLGQISVMEDPFQFLQSFHALGDLPASPASSVSPAVMTQFVSAQKQKLKDMCKQEKDKLFGILEKNTMSYIPVLHEEHTSRQCLLTRYKNSNMEVDPNTVAACLHLSDGNREISWGDVDQAHPDHPDRFSVFNQALCKASLSRDHYWEVEWDGGIVAVAVSYKGIKRKGLGNDSCFGHNQLSWKLVCSPSGCTFWHNKLHRANIPPACSRRVGVYLHHTAGMLYFYSVSHSGSFTCLHQTQAMFTEPLYAGFSVDLGSTLKICKL